MNLKKTTITFGTVSSHNFVVGAKPPKLSDEAKRKLDRRRPSKKAAQLVASVAKAKVAVHF